MKDTVNDLDIEKNVEEENLKSLPQQINLDPNALNKIDKIADLLEEQKALDQLEKELKEQEEFEKEEQLKKEKEELEKEEQLKEQELKKQEIEKLDAFGLVDEFETKEDALFYWSQQNYENIKDILVLSEEKLNVNEEILIVLEDMAEEQLKNQEIMVEGFYFVSLSIIVSFAVKIFVDQISKW